MTIVKLIGRGATADVFALDSGYALKLFKSHIPQPVSEREYNNTRAAAACGIRVPKAVDYIEQDGRYGIVLEMIAGKSLMKLVSNPLAMRKYAKLFARLQYQMHQQTPEGLPRYKGLLAYNIRVTPLLSDAVKQKVLEILETLPDGKALCHGDFHPDNIMVDKKGPVIMDLMTICCGDPAADVARTLLMMNISPLPESVPVPVKSLLNRSRRQITKTYVDEYCRISPLAPADVEKWRLPIAAARLGEQRPAQEARVLQDLVNAALMQE